MSTTKLSGIYIVSGSIPPSALGGGVVSSSTQVISQLPQGTLSSSTQVIAALPTGTVSSSTQVVAALPTGTVSSSTQINTGSFSGSITTASYVSPSGLPAGTVSSSGQVSYTALTNIPSGIISSSTQFPSGIVSASSQVSYTGLSNIPTGIVSSSTQVVAALPINTISSSTQFKTLTDPFTGSFTGSHTGTFPYSGLTGTPTLWSSSAQLPAGTVSSSGQVSYTALTNIPSGIVSSSTQVATLLPTGTVSSSTQINTGSFSGSITTASYVSPSGLPVGTVSSSGQISYTGLSNIPSGIMSSSTQTIANIAGQTVAPSIINATGAISGASIQTSGNGIIGGTLGVTGVATLTAQPILSSLTASKPVFTDASKGLVSTGTLGTDQGGTNLTTYTTGDILYASATNVLSKLPIGTTGQHLIVSGGIPSWSTDSALGTVTSVSFTGGLISVATATTTPALTVAGTSGGVVYFSSASTWASSAALTANALVLGGGAGAAPATTTTGTGVVTALGVNVGTAGAFVVNGGALGTPSSGAVAASLITAGTFGAGAYTFPGALAITGAFTGATTGAFSGNITVGSTISLGAAGTASGLAYFLYQADANSRSWCLRNDQTTYGDFEIQQATTRGGGTYAYALRFDASRNATFAGTLAVTGAITQNGNQVLHAGNYTSYSPSLTGGSASGTWSINVTGNAATVTNATFIRQFTVRDDRSDGNDYSLAGRATGLYAIAGAGTNGPGTTYLSLIHVANSTDVAFQIAGGYTSDNMYFRGTSALQSGTSYTTWRTVIHSGNIGSQSVSYATTAGSAPNASNVNNYYNVTPGEGYGVRFWSSDSYKISMGSSSLYQYGPVNDYSIKTQMNDGDTGRGFTWGRISYAPIAAINSTSGNMQIAGTFTAVGSITVNGITIQQNNVAQNVKITTAGGTDSGVSLYNSSGTWLSQWYGAPGTYGFLGGNWAGWDLQKNIGGDLYINNNIALHAGNYSSYAVPIGGATLTNVYYFRSNRGAGTYCGSQNSAQLEAYSSDGGTAFMSFHRGGYYAVNMGLDSDNIMRIGGWSAPANRWELDMSGNNWVASSFRSPIFYDSNNTGYYVDPNGTSNFSTTISYSYQGNGNVGGTGSASWHPSGIYSAGYNWLYGGINGGGSSGTGFSDLRASVFYDYDNTGYYVDPTSTSKLNTLNVNNINTGNTINIGNNNNGESVSTSSFRGLEFADTGARDYYIGKDAGSWTQPLAIHFYTGIRIRTHKSYGGTQFYNIFSGNTPLHVNNGTDAVEVTTTLSSPIFYDYNNTGYYLAPGSTSNLNTVYAVSYITSSDMRLKTNITPIISALTKLNTITGYTFEFIKDSGKRRSGVLAQEIQDILPEAVYTDADGYLSVSYDAIIPLLIQAIKEQQKKIEELETFITRT